MQVHTSQEMWELQLAVTHLHSTPLPDTLLPFVDASQLYQHRLECNLLTCNISAATSCKLG